MNQGKIRMRTKLAFGFGQIGESMFMGLVVMFSTLYYNQALMLENMYIGIAATIAIFLDAVSDPVIGSLSDRWKSRWGRRHPFLFVSAVPLAICTWLLFTPPESLLIPAPGETIPPQFPLFLWMTVWMVLGRFFMTLYIVPHLALGAELSDDYNERASVFSFNTIFGFFSAGAMGMIAWGVFFSGKTVRASDGQLVAAQLDPANYPILVLGSCIAMIIGIWICTWGTRDVIPTLGKPPVNPPPFSISSVIGEMLGACRNRSYLMILIGFFLLSMTLGMNETLGAFMQTFFWEFTGKEIKFFPLLSLGGMVLGAIFAPKLIKRFEKRPVAVGVTTIYAVLVPTTVIARLMDLLPANGEAGLLPILLVHALVLGLCLGALTVCVLSMLADIVDQHTLATGNRQEGIFYSARTFFAKASNSFAHLVAGFALQYIVVMPFGAVPGQVADDVILRLGLVSGPLAALASLAAVFAYGGYSLTRADHAEIRAQLDAREEEERRAAATSPQPEGAPARAGLQPEGSPV